MTKFKLTKKEILKDLFITQLQMLRIRLVENIADIDKHIGQIERRFESWINK